MHNLAMPTANANAYDRGTVPAWTLADKIRKARDITGLKQEDFAVRISVTPSSLAAYETGRATPPFKKVQTIAKSIQALTGIPATWFLYEDLPEPSSPKERPSDYPTAVPIEPRPVVFLAKFGARASVPRNRTAGTSTTVAGVGN